MRTVPIEPHARDFLDVIEARGLLVDRGKAAEQRDFRWRALHQHDMPVGEITGEAGTRADELPARAIEGYEPLGDGAVLEAVDDAQHLHLAAFPVCERAVVVECG